MNELIESLSNAGLSEKEALTYVTLLKIGQSSVKKISLKSGLKRPNTYILLEELRKKGFVLQIPFSNKMVYEAKQPIEIKKIIEERYDKFKKSYTLLESLKSDKETFNSFYFEGNNGIKDAYQYKLEELKDKDIIGFWAKSDALSPKVEELHKSLEQTFTENKTRLFGITPIHYSVTKNIPLYPDAYKNIKFLPESEYASEISIEACGSFTRIVDIEEGKAVIIESKKLSDTLISIYKLIEKKL